LTRCEVVGAQRIRRKRKIKIRKRTKSRRKIMSCGPSLSPALNPLPNVNLHPYLSLC
jgi:hypothetical protein